MPLLSQDNATYQTSGKNISFVARMFPSLRFYFSFFGIVLRSSRKAKNGIYDDVKWFESSIEVLRALENVGLRFDVKGLEHMSRVDGPAIFIANHLSMLETTILPSLIFPYKPVTFVVKQSLVEYPVFKHVMRSRNPITVTRTNPRQDLKAVLEQGQDRLDKGISVIIFPQTTRTPFDPVQFSTIGVKLAKKTGVPVIPIALLTDAWENGKKLKDFGKIVPARKVYFEFGDPMTVSGKGTDEHQQIIDFIQARLALWQR